MAGWNFEVKKAKKLVDPAKDPRLRHNWRIDMLAIPNNHPEERLLFGMTKKEREEYLAKKEVSSGDKSDVSSWAVKRKVPFLEDKEKMARLDAMSYSPMRYYLSQKKIYGPILGEPFTKKMNDKMKNSSNTIYNEYRNARIKISKMHKKKGRSRSAKSGKSGKSKAGKSAPKGKKLSMAERRKLAIEHCKTLCKPKPPPKPPKVNRGKRIKDLAALQPKLKMLCKPKYVYKSPSKDSMSPVNRQKVRPEALKYKASDRIREIALPKAKGEQEPPLIPGAVNPSALTYKITENVAKLAIPKPKPTSTELDYNEDAFKISPAALKYVATKRIQELAQPRERD